MLVVSGSAGALVYMRDQAAERVEILLAGEALVRRDGCIRVIACDVIVQVQCDRKFLTAEPAFVCGFGKIFF